MSVQRWILCLPCFLLVVCFAARNSDAAVVSGISDCAIDSTWQPFMPRLDRPLPPDERVAFHVAEYAGVVRDTGAVRETSLVVQLTDVEAAPEAMLVVRRQWVLGHNQATVPMRFVKVSYSYRQLRSWLECYLRGAGAGDITTWGVNTLRNRVGLSVRADSIRPKVEAALRRLGLPIEAFEIRVGWVETTALPPSINEALNRIALRYHGSSSARLHRAHANPPSSPCLAMASSAPANRSRIDRGLSCATP